MIDRAEPAFMSWEIPVEGQTMWDWQKFRCAMCEINRDVVLDHDHDTGLTRGYLCRSCNMAEGRSGASCWWLWRTGRNPARIFGWEDLYLSPSTGLPVIDQPESDNWRELAAAALDRPRRKQGGKEAAEALDR